MNTIWDDFDGKPRRKGPREMGYEQGFADAKAQYEPKWIPASERLPEEYGNYLVYVSACDGTATINYMWVDHYGPEWLHDEKTRKVIAWMPLPKPYKTESSETEQGLAYANQDTMMPAT